MAIAFVAKNHGTTDYGTSITVTKPTGTASGHCLIAVVGGSPSTPSGWTLLGSVASGTSSLNTVAVYYKIAGGSEPSSYTFSLGSASLACAVVAAYSGVDTTTPVDTTSGHWNVTAVGSGTNYNTSSVTAASTQWGITWAMSYEFGTATVRTWTEGSGTERDDFGVTDAGSPDNTNCSLTDSNGNLSAGSFTRTQTRSVSGSGGAKGTILLNTANSTVNVSDSDSSSGTESQSIQVTFSSSDAASGTDSQSVSNSVNSSDAASGTEGAARIALANSDSASGNESNSIAATRSDSDSGHGTDAGLIAQNSSDTGHGTEAQSTAVTLSNSDSVHGTDDQTATSPFPSSSDAVTATDSATIVVSLSSSDSVSTTESWSTNAPPIPRDPKDYPNILVMGPGSVYLANFGAVEPTTVGDPNPAIWTDLGGILDGVDLTVGLDYKVIELTQMPDTQIRRLNKRYLTVKMELAEPTLNNLMYALNEVPASIGSGSGYQNLSPALSASPANQLNYRAVLIRGWRPGFQASGQHKRRTVILRKAISSDTVQISYSKTDQSTYTVSWSCFYVDGSTPPFFIMDET